MDDVINIPSTLNINAKEFVPQPQSTQNWTKSSPVEEIFVNFGSNTHPISYLYELAQKKRVDMPKFIVTTEMSNKINFRVECQFQWFSGKAEARTKKDAKTLAAKAVIVQLQLYWNQAHQPGLLWRSL